MIFAFSNLFGVVWTETMHLRRMRRMVGACEMMNLIEFSY